jgi:Putative beta-barrel porin-2, OmpL-like. bbp2
MLQRIFTCLLVFQGFTASWAQIATTTTPDSTVTLKPILEIGGFVDAYYRYDLAKTAANNRTSFTNSHNSFELGMASVRLGHAFKSVGMVADIGFGRRAEEFAYTDDRTRFVIKQLYLNYTVKGYKFTAGSWATHVGYELVDAYANRNYSMSYLFSYGPFSHTGVKVEKSFGRLGAMLGVANPTDLRSAFQGSGKYLVGQLSGTSKNEKFKFYLNAQNGKPNDTVRVSQIDAVATFALTSKFNIGVNGTLFNYEQKTSESDNYGPMQHWMGSALYLNYDPLSFLGITLRSELFNDQDQLNVFSGATAGGTILANTFSLNFKLDNLTVIPEVRFEKASEAIFLDTDGGTKDTAISLLMAAVYRF